MTTVAYHNSIQAQVLYRFKLSPGHVFSVNVGHLLTFYTHFSRSDYLNLAPSWRRFFQRITRAASRDGQHNRTSLLRYLFPNANVTQSTRARLFNFRYWFLPTLKIRAQASIHQYLVGRQARRRKGRFPRIVSNLQGRTPTFWRHRNLKDGRVVQSGTMAYAGTGSGYGELSGLRSEGREPGARRKKLAGYLKAANEMRQSYFADGGNPGSRDGSQDAGVEGPGSFPDAAVVRSGNEEMILFPSYARKHVKSRPRPTPAPDSEMSEQEYWHREWERHQDDNAIVDVDVRGWIYTPHRGQTSRKQRLVISIARQLTGLPPPPSAKPQDSDVSSQTSSRGPSPRPSKHEEEHVAQQAENIVRKGEQEQRYARRGAFSEVPVQDRDGDSVYNYSSRTSSGNTSPERGRQDYGNHRLSHISLASSNDVDTGNSTPQNRSSWSLPAKMSSSQLVAANTNLLNRLKPFMAYPLPDAPISAFFYNDKTSRQHTVYTNASGHFSCRAALDFVPTHVRVLAAERLSATEEVTVTSPSGVSLISDVDDTIKHSAINDGAREIFRNAFIRELGDLTIDGVREWYNTLHDMGVKLHYVSNSPWQMYPVLTTYFKLAHLPKGSFHLKQYSGMLQGIFEPVAERKKSSLEKIMNDFPDRKFIFVGDSGEADLEVYTDVAIDNPGRVLGIFIRDVTTPVKTGYFDPSNGMSGAGGHVRNHSRNKSGEGLETSKRLSRPDDIRDDDADLRAAIAASLADMEHETRRTRKSINPDSPSPENLDTPRPRSTLPARRSNERSVTQSPIVASPEEDLIDFSDDPAPGQTWLLPSAWRDTSPMVKANGDIQTIPSPSPPPKPQALRSRSPSTQQLSSGSDSATKPPPQRPRKPSSAVKPTSSQQVPTLTTKPPMPQLPPTASKPYPSPLSQVTAQSPDAKERPPLPTRPKTYGALSKGLASAHQAVLPATYWQSDAAVGQPRPTASSRGYSTPRTVSTISTKSTDEVRSISSSRVKAAPPPPPPPRLRNASSLTTVTANRKTSNRVSGGWDDGSVGSLPGSPGEAGIGKKEFLWNQRWARAKSMLDRHGITLRSWRVGSDVADVCVRLAEHALRDMEKENKADRK